MNKSFQNDNLGRPLEELKPQQRLVNVLFDEVKLKKAMRYTDSHIICYLSNNPNELATAALTIEIVCHFGGPRFILSITPGAKLKSFQRKDLLQEAIRILCEKGGCPVALICDNCPTNQGVYSLIGGPGVVLLPDGLSIYRKIRPISPGAYLFRKPFREGLSEGGGGGGLI